MANGGDDRAPGENLYYIYARNGGGCATYARRYPKTFQMHILSTCASLYIIWFNRCYKSGQIVPVNRSSILYSTQNQREYLLNAARAIGFHSWWKTMLETYSIGLLAIISIKLHFSEFSRMLLTFQLSFHCVGG